MPKLHETDPKSHGPIETVLNAVANLISRKNATETKADSNMEPDEPTAGAPGYAETLRKLVAEKQASHAGASDPAHAPGHRKLDREQPSIAGGVIHQSDSVLNNNAKSDIIHKTETAQRGNR